MAAPTRTKDAVGALNESAHYATMAIGTLKIAASHYRFSDQEVESLRKAALEIEKISDELNRTVIELEKHATKTPVAAS